MTAQDWTLFATVVLAHALAVASPGPDFAMVVRQSLAGGRAAGVWTAAGIGSGILFHIAYGLFGLGWLLERYPWALRLVGLAGGLFLIYMGLQALRAQPAQSPSAAAAGSPVRGRIGNYGIGLLTNLLNPKAILFFVALFTTVIAAPASTGLMLSLGLWLPLGTFLWYAGVSLLVSHGRFRLRLQAIAHWLDRAMGIVLLGLGLSAAANALLAA